MKITNPRTVIEKPSGPGSSGSGEKAADRPSKLQRRWLVKVAFRNASLIAYLLLAILSLQQTDLEEQL